MNRYICLDTETGGITLNTSLLTAYFAVFDENFTMVDELYLTVKPDDGVYHITAQGLGVNQIDIVQHDQRATLMRDARTPLYQFLQKNYQGEKLTPVGHGIYFDLLRVKQDLISAGSWENYVSYRTLDTSSVCQFLRAAGLFPMEVSGSLVSLVEYFKLPDLGAAHNAKTDALQTMAVLRRLVEIVRKTQ